MALVLIAPMVLAPHGGGGSADCARSGATRWWRSRWPCPKPCTTLLLEVHGKCRTQPYGDRSRTGQGDSGQESYRILAPQLVAEHVGCPCSCLPSLATPSLADATADAVDSASVRFFAASALAARRKDEAEERRRSTEEKVQLLAVPAALRTPEQKRRIAEICAESLASLPAGEEEQEEEEEEKASSVCSSSTRLSTSL